LQVKDLSASNKTLTLMEVVSARLVLSDVNSDAEYAIAQLCTT